jgi:hypothetical protein
MSNTLSTTATTAPNHAPVAVVERTVLFVENGENWGTIAPVCEVVVEGTTALATSGSAAYDLTETCWRCRAYDDDMQVQIPKYLVITVKLPEFLPVGEWAYNDTKWKYAWGAGMDATFPEKWQRDLANLGGRFIFTVAPLLKTYVKGKVRSDFRHSIAERIVEWLDTPASDRKYDSPLSSRQLEAISGPAYEWDRVSSRLYSRRRMFGVQ